MFIVDVDVDVDVDQDVCNFTHVFVFPCHGAAELDLTVSE